MIQLFIIIIKQAVQYMEQCGERDRKGGEANCELRVGYGQHSAGERDSLS
jgi:hypothetical protein